MTTERSIEDERRLERLLVAVRWLVGAFGAVQVVFRVRDAPARLASVRPLGIALVIGLLVGNLLLARAVSAATDPRRLRTIGFVAFGLDTAVILGLIWLASDGPADPVWVIGYLLPLEGAARWGLPGAFVGAALFLGGEVARELDLTERAPRQVVGAATIAVRAGMAFVVGAVTGLFASSLRREAAHAQERAREVEAALASAEAAAERERQARGEVAAFHAAVLAEPEPDPDRSGSALQGIADAIARELGCEAMGLLVRRRGSAGEVAFEAVGVHGDPGYLRRDLLPVVSDPVGAAAEEGEPILAGPDVVAPMLVRGEVIGALHERLIDGPPPDQERLRLLARLADQLGLVLESARMRADQEDTVRRLRELDEMKTDFIAITSHELRTPLSGIRGFVDMLHRRGDDLTATEREEFLDIVLVQTDRLIALVDDLLVVSKVEAGALTLSPEDTDVAPFLERVVRSLGDEADRVEIRSGTQAPPRIVIDPRRLEQIVTNLVHNALKFSEPPTPVTVTWSSPAEGVVAFAVRDGGAGIDRDELERIFERFHQTERSMTHTEGFGLGLYITKLLTEAMGGWVEVSSAPGEGTTFTVTFPASRNLPAPARPSAAARQGRTAS
jgi:signal transduction histidine kinase